MASLDDAQEARRLVRQITENHGYLSPEELQRITDPEVRRKVELAMLRKDEMIGSTVITLAKNLYTSRARFVLEMLQNADDNSYENARSAGQAPYMSFSVYPDRIIAECNEDGFNEANLAAICSVGKSSKTVAQGYIGEKGIGFKSVFMVCWQVHIQSRAFSFTFTHRRNDSGMGMISPVWEEAAGGPPRGVTRITLHLHREAMSGDLRNSINEQFDNLQETFLLFMKNLQRVSVAFHDGLGQPPLRSISYVVSRPETNRAVVQTISTNNGTSETTSKLFHVTTRMANNLPMNENRQYSDAEKASRAFSTSEVMLAFPLSADQIPIIQPQNLFVFLPVRSVGFNFIIQADFVTEASRQDVLRESIRNKELVQEIAKTFVLAIKQFCEHPTLRYQWMRYLPPYEDEHRGPLWSSLVRGLADELESTPALLGRRGTQFRRISDLVRGTRDVLDEKNEPLLLDGPYPGQLISPVYAPADLGTLQSYGLRLSSYGDILRWVREDLGSGKESRIRSTGMSDGWATRFANLLTRPVQNKNDWVIRQLKTLEPIPLADGSWVAASPGPVYLSLINGHSIPTDLALQLVSPKVTNAALLSLYELLGVRPAPLKVVQEKIMRRYGPFQTLTLGESVDHLRFLYRTHDQDNASQFQGNSIRVFDEEFKARFPTACTVYIKNDNPYGPWELFRTTKSGDGPGDGAPGFKKAVFLHALYLESAPEPCEDISWLEWLKRNIGVTDHVVFKSFEEGGELEYLQKHRPEKFMGSLRNSHARIAVTAEMVEKLRKAAIRSSDGRTWQMRDMFFPTADLMQRVERYVGVDKGFPWLWVDSLACGTPHEGIPDAWKSLLATLQVGIPASDVSFGLKMVEKLIFGGLESADPSDNDEKRIFDLYGHIASRYQESDKQNENAEEIWEFFMYNENLYVPPGEYVMTDACVWRAPADMETKIVLSLAWKRFFKNSLDEKFLENFFGNVVKVPSSCLNEELIEELRYLKSTHCKDIKTLKIWYKALDNGRRKQAAKVDMLKKLFLDEALIYLPLDDGDSWHTVANCVWSDAARLRNKAFLNDEYAELKDFFLEFLGVRQIDLEMAVTELKEASDGSSVADVKASIWTVNSLLEANEKKYQPQVPEGKIFPIREADGSRKCVDDLTDFFIVDREHESKAFEGRVRFLDFTLQEVARLRQFLTWAGIDRRRLSNCVKEVTTLGDSPSSLLLDREQQVANRAHALLRIALHSLSPRALSRQSAESLYDLLLGAQVYCTDGIRSGIQLVHDGHTHMADGKSVAVCLKEEDTGLKVYLPKARKERKHAFNVVLHKKVVEWFMTDPMTDTTKETIRESIQAATCVFGTDRSMLRETLEENGIAETEIENRDINVDSETASDVSDEEDDLGIEAFAALNLDDASTVYASADGDRSGFYSPSSSATAWESYSVEVSASRSYGYSSAAWTQPYRQPSRLTPPRQTSDDHQYVQLLRSVVAAARRASLPPFNTTDLSQSGTFTNDQNFIRFPYSSQLERDIKIGAAGELYVFELLSHVELHGQRLPNFSRENWQSNIRRFASAHPEYSDMSSWSGYETSDIVYPDSRGTLTSALVHTGYLNEQHWLSTDRRPRYYIEVKSTTSSCDTPFYMSKAQYARMEKNKLSPEQSDVIYVIFRVYNLGRESTGLKIYLDPATLKDQGSLQFTGEHWSVTPQLAILP